MAKFYLDLTPTPWRPRNGTAGAAIDALFDAAAETGTIHIGHISITLTGVKACVAFLGSSPNVAEMQSFLKQRVQARCDVVGFLLGVNDK